MRKFYLMAVAMVAMAAMVGVSFAGVASAAEEPWAPLRVPSAGG